MADRQGFDARVNAAFPNNTTKLITPMKTRDGVDAAIDFTAQVQLELQAEDTRVEGKVDGVIAEIGDEATDISILGKIKNSDDDIKELKRINEEVTDPALALLPDLRTDVDAAKSLADTNEQGLIDTNLRIDGLPTTGGNTPYDDTTINNRITNGLLTEMNARVDADNLLRAQTNKIPQLRIDVDAANTQATTNKDDILTEKGRIDELIRNPVSGVSEEKVEELIEENKTTAADFLIRSGATAAQTPGIAYRGSGDEEFANANAGVVYQRATGQFTVPAVTLTDIPAGTPFRWSQAYLNPGKTGRQSGFDPILYYVIEQGVNRLVGAGAVGSSDNLATDWVAIDNIESPSELRTDHLITGEAFIVRWIAIYNGVDATLVPSLSSGNVSFVGQYEPEIEGIVHDVTDARFNTLESDDQRLLTGLQGANTNIESNRTRIDSADGLIQGLRDKFDEPQFQAIEEATIVPSDTQTLDATTLNDDLGLNNNPFAGKADDPIGQATQFITRFTRPEQALYYGSGQIARVIDGHFIVYSLIPARQESTATNTRYITTPSGYGTRTRPAVLEFGSLPPGQTVKQAADSEVFLDTGVPASVLPDGTTISNLSVASGVRTNGNWAGIQEELVFALRSNVEQTFAIPGVTEMTLRAISLPDGRTRVRATHNRGTGNSNDLVTNAGAIRFDCGYTETVITPAQDAAQMANDLGTFTGNELIAVDVGAIGNNSAATAMIVTPTATYDTGYVLSEIHRTGFRTDNPEFDIFASNPDTALTPAIMARLVGTDQYLGLFARNNHHDDALQFAHGVVVPTSDGTMTFNVGDSIKRLEDIPTGTGLTETKARELATEVINNSPVIQANTAKPTETVIDQKITDAVSAIVFPTPPVQRTDEQVDTRADNRIITQLDTGGTIRAELDTISLTPGPSGAAATAAELAPNAETMRFTISQEDTNAGNELSINPLTFVPVGEAVLPTTGTAVFGYMTATVVITSSSLFTFNGVFNQFPANNTNQFIPNQRAYRVDDGAANAMVQTWELRRAVIDFSQTQPAGWYLDTGELSGANDITATVNGEMVVESGEAGVLYAQDRANAQDIFNENTRGIIENGITINNGTSEERVTEIANAQIEMSLEADGAVANYVRNNTPSADIAGALDSGLQRFIVSGSGPGNFTADVPTSGNTAEVAEFNAVLRINSEGGSAPDSYTYTSRYGDGDRSIIVGVTTATAQQAFTGIQIGPFNILPGRIVEVQVSVNGGVGSNQNWSLQATLGSGTQGELYLPAVDLIQERLDLFNFPDGYTDDQVRGVIEGELQEGRPLAEAIKAGADGIVLADFAPDTLTTLCTVIGDDQVPDSTTASDLTLICSGGAPTSGTADLGGDVTLNTSIPTDWNGEYRLLSPTNELLYSGTAVAVSGQGTTSVVYRVDGADWDFANTVVRFVMTPGSGGSTITPNARIDSMFFNGELTRGNKAGIAVAPVQLVFSDYIAKNPVRNAYDEAVFNGFDGNRAEWLVSLRGESAYELALAGGFEGTIGEWRQSLKGQKGDPGQKGDNVVQRSIITINGNTITQGTQALPDLDVAPNQIRRVLGFGARIVSARTVAGSATLSMGISGVGNGLSQNSITMDLANEGSIVSSSAIAVGRDGHQSVFFILTNQTTGDNTGLVVELSVAYIIEDLFPAT